MVTLTVWLTQDKTWDTKKYLSGNPILISMATQPTVGATNYIYNCSEFFTNKTVPAYIVSPTFSRLYRYGIGMSISNSKYRFCSAASDQQPERFLH